MYAQGGMPISVLQPAWLFPHSDACGDAERGEHRDQKAQRRAGLAAVDDGVRRALDMNALYAAMGLEGRNTL